MVKEQSMGPGRSRLWVSMLLAGFVLMGGGFRPASAAAPGFIPFALAPYFSCEIPKNWGVEKSGERSFGLSPEEKKVYGISLHGPAGPPPALRIDVEFYARGNLLHNSPEVYIRRHAEPLFGQFEGESYGPVEVTIVAEKAAWTFERQKHQFVPAAPDLAAEPPADPSRIYARPGLRAMPVAVRERFVVVSSDAGFYALHYIAPAERFGEFLPLFEQVVATFRPQR